MRCISFITLWPKNLHPSSNTGGSSGCAAEGPLQSFSLDTQTGSATLWKLTGTVSPSTRITIAQSTLDLHHTLKDFSTLHDQIALHKAISHGLHTPRANEVGDL